MKDLFKNPRFIKLFAAGVTSQLGNTIGNMALAFFLLDRFSTQPFYATLAELMYSAPTLLVFFLVGVLADRMDRKRICAYSDWIRAGLTVGLLGAVTAGWMPLVFLVLFIRSAVGKFFYPAQSALMQSILKEEHYTTAAGMNQMVFSLFMLFGTGLGALAYHYIGIQGAVLVDGLGFLISGVLIQSMRIEEKDRLPNGRTRWKDIGLPLIVEDFRKGIGYIWTNKLLLALITGFFMLGFINGSFAVLPMFTMKYKLAPDDYQRYSSLFSIFLGIGVFPGSLAGAWLIRKWGFIRIMIAGLLASGIVGVGMLFATNVWVYLAATTCVGLTIGPLNVAIGGWMPRIIDSGIRGRVNAWTDPIMMASQSAALGLIAVLFPKYMTLEAAYTAVGVCLILTAALYLWKLPRLAASQGGWNAGRETAGAVPENSGASLAGVSSLEETL
ncbi:MFS transporter [Paenibacillus mesotrionivorans]|jgi:MFS family permease|uniref:MFS transporter n=1 Tax=Paenibacillus mesotrionivorans TaxID=3160968 RepID=A0ACC7P1E0_9BACL